MKALISPLETTQYISGWTVDNPPVAVIENIPNAYRIVEVAEQEFEVAEPFYWVDIADNLVTENVYYDSSDNTIKIVQDVAEPTV